MNRAVSRQRKKARKNDSRGRFMGQLLFKQMLLVLLLAVFMLATLGCSSTDIPDSVDLPDSAYPSDSHDSLDQNGLTVDDDQDGVSENSQDQGNDGIGEADHEGKGQAGNSPGTDAEMTGDSNSQSKPKDEKTLTCTYSISCVTIFDNLDKISDAVLGLQPKDGWIFSPKEIEFQEGESVFDILLGLTKQEKIHMEFNSNPALNSKYVEGINNLYEFDVGELSGWTYKINGKGMGYGSSSSYPKDGDTIEWVYTCDQGRDVGYEP